MHSSSILSKLTASCWKPFAKAGVIAAMVTMAQAGTPAVIPDKQPAPVTAQEDTGADNLLEMFTKGKFSGQARYRFEIQDQDSSPTTPMADDLGIASTVRLALGFETAEYYGFSLFAEGEGVLRLGYEDRYHIPRNPTHNNPEYPIVADPEQIELSQFWINWDIPDTSVSLRVGREDLQLLNGRFIGNSSWRQNHQAIDLASIKGSLELGGGKLFGQYAYMSRLYRTVGWDATDSPLDMDSHLFNVEWSKKDVLTASAYGILADFDRLDVAANSTSTVGLRVFGPYMLSSDLGIHYTADYAYQSDYGNNPNDVGVSYWLLEGGVVYKKHKIFGGWTVLEGKSATNKVSSLMAPPHNGWTEKFLLNPSLGDSHGLNALYVTATGPFPGVKSLTYTLTFYDYHSDSNRIHYGNELDAQLEYKFAKYWSAGWRFGNYWADNLFTDHLRTSVYVAFTF